MSKNDSSFQDLEKQLAKDALEKALKDLHGEITKDIDKNKAVFSNEIKQTLNNFKTDLEKTVSKELDQRISANLQKHFVDISSKIISSFDESSSPFLKSGPDNVTKRGITSWGLNRERKTLLVTTNRMSAS